MDGNGRWAKARGLPRIEGHQQGAERVDEIVTVCRELGVRYLTLYAFSMENWARPKDEIAALMMLLKHFLVTKREKLLKNEIRLVSIGDTERFPPDVLQTLRETEEMTQSCTRMVLNLALSYSSRDEVIRAINTILKEKEKGTFRDNFISVERFSDYLDTSGMPDPDLIIRTSGENRISNFLLWQAAYAELYFTETPWPDFGREGLYKAIGDYQSRERRFGKTSEQVRS
ncbi:MAG: di-trans,poly-cis-decaprenylcistransferase [Deltaproteobacteria bacterium]|nr:di-trans,poly-cis-decaprenylcistransferase [Deltaproteobacteria bacterium]MBI2501052.1 di-trans,poly-cis-decaprenylcistransferase [Deltaproteobacteria bacterium]